MGPNHPGDLMDTRTLLRIFAGCARREISRLFLFNSCIASTAATLDVMAHYGRRARAWEVCARVMSPSEFIELGCYPSQSEEGVGGHLVAIVDESFLVDASLGQLNDANPNIRVPSVFIGELMPPGPPTSSFYEFRVPGATLAYEQSSMSQDYRSSPDWGNSPEREAVRAAIVRQIDGFRASRGIV